MPIANWSQVAGTIFLGLVGLWLAHNYRRQIRLKLAERQVDAYMRLWTLTAPASPERPTPPDRDERQKLADGINRWYFDEGAGIFVSAPTRDLLVGVLRNLTCPVGALRPAVLARDLAGLPDAEAERRRGCAIVRQMSLLRTQLKTDLAMHLGFSYYNDLQPDDRALLRSCGLSPWRGPWRPRLFRPSQRANTSSCVCGSCPVPAGSAGSP
jgi:hypothetical protein